MWREQPCQPWLMAFLSFVVRDVVIVGQPNPAEQLHASQLSTSETAVHMEAAQGESLSLFMLT